MIYVSEDSVVLFQEVVSWLQD